MASLKVHTAATMPLAAVAAVYYPPDSLFGITLFLAVLLYGILVDLDHFAAQAIKDCLGLPSIRWYQWPAVLLKHRAQVMYRMGRYIEGWICSLHTVPGALIVIGAWQVTLLLANKWRSWPAYLPIAAYWLHMLLDAANALQQTVPSEPLPRFLNRLIPSWLAYNKDKSE